MHKSAKNPSYFSAQDSVKVSPRFAVVSQITSTNWKKPRTILRDWVHTSVGLSNLENCSEHRKTFTQFCAEKIWGFFFALYRMKFDLV